MLLLHIAVQGLLTGVAFETSKVQTTIFCCFLRTPRGSSTPSFLHVFLVLVLDLSNMSTL